MFKRSRWIVGFVVAIPLLAALYFGLLQLNGNFHEAIPGELYRSAQFTPGDLTRYEARYHIRSVLNLRGEHDGEIWYNNEREEAQLLGIQHMNFRMNSGRELSHVQAMQLIAMMRNAPKPLLIHCRAGADRTGLASALYFAAIAKRSEWESERQLWPIYGHLPVRFISAYAMNRTFESLEPYLGFSDS